MIRSSNPTLRGNTFSDPRLFQGITAQDTMTIQGTVNKTGILLAIVVIVAGYTWNKWMETVTAGGEPPMALLWVGAIGGFATAMITVFFKRAAVITAPLYGALEGMAIGSISVVMEQRFHGIVTQAVLATFGVFGVMLFLYKTRVIKATENFKLGVAAATGGICFIYLITFVLGFFGTSIPYIHASGPVGIGFSVFVCAIAALNLVMDFDFIEKGEEAKAPKFMEWYGAFALLVTLIWLYIEILRLLSKSRSRR